MKRAQPEVLILYTGGTIGMIKDAVTGQLKSFNFDLIDEHVPELRRLNVNMTTISFEDPIDSSEMDCSHWIRIGETIRDHYDRYDGFVVLHGSDTMAYTASALSFMFDGLKKPVIVTGSQLPIGIIRTDGKENLITAIEIAAARNERNEPIVQEVAIYFEYHLYRGNRSTKDSASLFEAFRSPNYQELAVAGVHIDYNHDRMHRSEAEEFSLCTELNNRIALVKLFPGMDFSAYTSVFDRLKIDGVILETFGAGNAPSKEAFRKQCADFIDNGGVILNITQCSSGGVEQGLYETSAYFDQIGVIAGGDMTTEAAVTKMMLALGKKDVEESKAMLRKNLRGEVTFAGDNLVN